MQRGADAELGEPRIPRAVARTSLCKKTCPISGRWDALRSNKGYKKATRPYFVGLCGILCSFAGWDMVVRGLEVPCKHSLFLALYKFFHTLIHPQTCDGIFFHRTVLSHCRTSLNHFSRSRTLRFVRSALPNRRSSSQSTLQRLSAIKTSFGQSMTMLIPTTSSKQRSKPRGVDRRSTASMSRACTL